jgi:hypothetical protein
MIPVFDTFWTSTVIIDGNHAFTLAHLMVDGGKALSTKGPVKSPLL